MPLPVLFHECCRSTTGWGADGGQEECSGQGLTFFPETIHYSLQVNYWLGGLMEVKSNDLYRMKGVLAIKDFPARFVFQG